MSTCLCGHEEDAHRPDCKGTVVRRDDEGLFEQRCECGAFESDPEGMLPSWADRSDPD